jgi:hypothetical protein
MIRLGKHYRVFHAEGVKVMYNSIAKKSIIILPRAMSANDYLSWLKKYAPDLRLLAKIRV